jgi:hypothetical protein
MYERCSALKNVEVRTTGGSSELPLHPVGYSCERLFTVREIQDAASSGGFIPMILLPKSLIGKTVKVTIEEQI